MKVVFIITGLGTGGAETMLFKVIERLDRKVFEPHVISLSTLGDFGPRIQSLGVPVEALGMQARALNLMKFLKLIARLRSLRPDVVHTWMYHADLLGGLAARAAGIKAVGWGVRHSNLNADVNKGMTLRIVKLCAHLSRHLPKRIMTCSIKAKRVHAEYGYDESRMVVVPNGFDLGRFKPDDSARQLIRDELSLSQETPLVGLVARYNPQKNIEGFLIAADLVVKARSDVHFVLVGKGLEKSNAPLMDYVKKFSDAANLHFLGRRDDIPKIMASLDLLVSSSHGEAFPNVLGEAMACEVPCVVTDAGDSADIVGDTGMVVDVGDMEGLSREVLTLLGMGKSERQGLGLRARKRVQECYEINSIVKQYEAFYLRLVDSKNYFVS